VFHSEVQKWFRNLTQKSTENDGCEPEAHFFNWSSPQC